MRRREDRNAELETRLSEHEGSKVAAEAEALNSSLAAAMRDVRGFFSSGGKVDVAKSPSFNGGGEAFATFDATSPKKDSGVLRSGLKKKASRGEKDSGEPTSGAKKMGQVTFVAESEQKRLEEEGGYVAKLQAKTAENETLVSRLLATETSLERKREQMRVAKEAYQALQKRLEEETRRREEAEKRDARRGATTDSSSSDRRHATVPDAVPETRTEREKKKRETTEALLRDVLSVTAHACGVSGRADSRAVTTALPALAALAKAGPGEVALELLTETRVVEHITRVFEMHEDDATAAAKVCSTLAALVAGARAAAAAGGAARRRDEVLESAAPSLARVVSRALAKHRSSPEACACACDLLHALTHKKNVSGNDFMLKTVTSELVRAGCAVGATDAAEWHPSDEDVATSAARAIVSMVEHCDPIDSASIARCGAASVVLRAERYGIDTGIGRAGREVEAWARESAKSARVDGDEKKTLTFSAAAEKKKPSTTPRRRAAIPEEAAYEGSGFKPRVAVPRDRRGSNRGVRDANGDATGGDRTWDGTAAEEDDFDDAQFDDKL